MQNVILTIILVVIVGLAAWYVYRAKKNGRKCIGCPGSCSQNKAGCASCCGCSRGEEE